MLCCCPLCRWLFPYAASTQQKSWRRPCLALVYKFIERVTGILSYRVIFYVFTNELQYSRVRVCFCWRLSTAYWYRDDSLALWDVIWKFVDAILSLYYKDDVAVLSDGELAAMLAELRQQSLTSLVRSLLLVYYTMDFYYM